MTTVSTKCILSYLLPDCKHFFSFDPKISGRTKKAGFSSLESLRPQSAPIIPHQSSRQYSRRPVIKFLTLTLPRTSLFPRI